MTKENKIKAIEICMKHRITIEFHPVISGFVKEDYLGVTYACPAAITALVENGYQLSCNEGHMIIDKF